MTIRAALASQYPLADKMPAEQWSELAEIEGAIDRYKLFVGHFRYSFREFLPDDTKAFTFLRDPVERTISHLEHLRADPHFHELHELARGRDLRDIAQDPRIMSQCSNVMVGWLGRPRAGVTIGDLRRLEPDDAYFDAPEDIESAVATLDGLDFVGCVDDLDADFARLCDLLGLHPPVELPRINAATERPGGTAADSELFEIIRAANALDLAFYAEARRRRGSRQPLPPREKRLCRLLDTGVYTPIDGPTVFPVSGPVPCVGLWEQEQDGRSVYRWTGPQNDLVFELPLPPGRPFVLEIETWMQRDTGELTGWVDDSPVAIQRTGGPGVKLRIAAEAGSEGMFTTVRLRAERLSQASETDRRMLGFVLVSMAVDAE